MDSIVNNSTYSVQLETDVSHSEERFASSPCRQTSMRYVNRDVGDAFTGTARSHEDNPIKITDGSGPERIDTNS